LFGAAGHSWGMIPPVDHPRDANSLPHGATARRPGWADLPAAVRDEVEQQVGQRVVAAESQGAGFTNGLASRLTLADGSRVFVKAVGVAEHPMVAASYRQEQAVVTALPSAVPAPRLLWSTEVPVAAAGDAAGDDAAPAGDDPAGAASWLVLAFEDVTARAPRRPWRLAELRAVLDVLPGLAAALTPPPAGLPDLPTVASISADFRYWQRAEPPDVPVPVPLAELAALEAEWVAATAGDTAGHFDLRDDNLLITPDGRVLVCDWNWLTVGAPWLDLVGLLVSVHGDGLDADAELARSPLTRDVPARAIDAYLAGLAGYFTEAAARPAVPGSPWVRVHQAWYRDATLGWLAHRSSP